MIWLLVLVLICAINVVAGRAHSRYLDRLEARSDSIQLFLGGSPDCVDQIKPVDHLAAEGSQLHEPRAGRRSASWRSPTQGHCLVSTPPRRKRPPQSTLGKRLALLDNATSAKYCSCVLRSTIEAIVGKDSKIGDLAHRVVIPTVNLTKGSPQVFKTDHHPTFQRDWKVPIVDVALATSAAPTFFPLHRIGGELFADGGLYANSPDDLALHEAEHFLDQARSEISMLSVGTTTAKFSFSNSGDTDLGWMGWMDNQRLPRVMISSQQLNAEYMMRHRLKDNYLRIDHQQSPEQERFLALDVASPGAISDMKALAESSVRDALGKTNLPALLKHVAAPPAFYNRSGT
ncbi:CBASS cGAMP-activated phospholipase [Bradyrhizobium sp. AZCC 2289]|uniref:CBASS cGAMP-activated phospholipase n=1 Tax=Bradyrhizobium sp. AZCC 2289 TaxID=3117026 RepID=UPI002FF34C0A